MMGSGSPEYSFTDPEIRSIALLLRRNESVLDASLDTFRCFIEGYLYRIMTIEEAEAFFNEK